MEFGLLGPVVVWDHGRELPIGRGKQQALLCILLLRANEAVATSRLVDELWGEKPPPTAVKAVQVHVSQLRKALGEGVLVTEPGGYRLRVGQGALDQERFESLLDQGRLHLAADAPREAGDALRAALAMWRGPPLAGFEFDAWATNEIGRLEELRLTALELRLEADLALGRHAEAVGELAGLVRDHPLRESLRGLLMAALYRSGRQADALAVYQEGRVALLDGLGLDPSEALQRLEGQILRHDASLDLPVAPASRDPMPAPAVVAAAPAAPGEARKVVTVLFCDVGSDEQADPEALRGALARSFEKIATIVSSHGGTAEQMAGSAVMAVFGVPAVRQDDALRALNAALEICGAPLALGLRASVGVQSGEVIVGGTGAIAGNAVAVAMRLAEAATAGEVLIGGLTLELTARAVDVEEIEPLPPRGGDEPLGVFRVLHVHEIMEPAQRMRFVGRAGEVALIRDAWERVVEGQACELVTVVGEAGIGKSRLTAEALAPFDALVVQGRCLSFGDGITYWPVREVLNQLVVAPPTEAAEPIGALLGSSPAGTSPGEIAWAFRKTLEYAAALRPLIVVFDDIQWGEDAFLDLVEQASLLSTGAPILLLCVARPELLEHRPSWPVTIRLEPLADTTIDELIPDRISAPLREKITRASGGNPLFVQEMLAVVADADQDLVVPLTLQAVLAARLDQLEPDERAILTYGAIEGETFHHGAIQALAPAEIQVAARLASLVRKGLIWPGRPDLPGQDGYRFRHILIRDAAYATLPKPRRSERHAGFADWLVTAEPAWAADHPDILAYHYATALELAREAKLTEHEEALKESALRFLILAGERAADIDPAAAIASFERALALQIDDPRERVRVQLELGFLLDETGRIAESAAILAVGLEAAAGLEERGLVARALVRISHQRLVADVDVGGEEILLVADDAIETFTELGDSLGLARAQRMRAMALSRLGRTTESYAALEHALVHADASGDQPTRRYVIGTLCYLLCDGPALVGEAIDRCEELLRSSESDRVVETLVSRHLSLLLAMAARFDDSRELLLKAGPVFEELNQSTQHGLSRDSVAEARELSGDLSGAEQELVALWELFRDARGDAPESRAVRAASLLALLYCDAERWDDAAACLAYGPELPEPTHFRPAVVLRLAAEARLVGHRGEDAEAVRRALLAVELAEQSDRLNLRARVWLALSQVHRGNGQTAEAAEAAAAALRLYEAKGNIAAAAHLSALDLAR